MDQHQVEVGWQPQPRKPHDHLVPVSLPCRLQLGGLDSSRGGCWDGGISPVPLLLLSLGRRSARHH